MPVYTTVVLLASLVSMGLPDSLVLLERSDFPWSQVIKLNGAPHASLAIVATLGLVIAAAYYLWTLQRMFFGPFHLKGSLTSEMLDDIDRREYIMLLPLAIVAIALGIFPQPLISIIDPFARHFAEFVTQAGHAITFTP